MATVKLLLMALPFCCVTTLSAQTPAPRHHHALTWDPVRKQVLMSGGHSVDSTGNGPILDDLWSWDGQRWTALAVSTGLPLLGHSFFADRNGALFARGGSHGVTSRWSEDRWVTVYADSALRLGGAAGAYDPTRGRFVLFGGSSGPGVVTSGTWMFNGTTWTQLDVTGPPAMMMASMVFDSKRHVMVLFGGWDPRLRRGYGETWEFDGARWRQVRITGPSARNGPGMAFDAARGEVILFGGSDPDSDTPLGDTWIYNGREWRRLNVPGPSARFEPMMAFDAERGETVLFGGHGGSPAQSLGDTWEWDGRQWRRQPRP